MSMNMCLKQASEMEIARLAREGIDPDALLEDSFAFGPKKGAGAKNAVLNLDKSWHVLHFLFTGRAWDGPLPAGVLLAGGREVGEDLGYGPARTLTPDETKAFAKFLSGQSVPALAKRIDTGTMKKLGISGADHEDAGARADLEADVDHYLPQLQTYVGGAAKDGNGLVIWMS